VTATSEGVGAARRFEVVCAVAGMTVEIDADTSILEAVRRAGLPVPVACTDARCGACETRVLDGVPDHRDEVLTGEERAFGETMMICVSRATSPWLVLDL
jgi:ferredoxin